MAEYKVKFEVFEGPLDLLLYLIKKEEVDIYDVNLTQLATQFIEYIEVMRLLDLEIAGEFLVMASTLMYIKSRELLPVEQQVADRRRRRRRGSALGTDPPAGRIQKVQGCRRASSRRSKSQQENIFPRIPVKPNLSRTAPGKPEVSLFDLVNAVSSILKRITEREGATRDVFEDRWTVSEKIEHIMTRLTRASENELLRFVRGRHEPDGSGGYFSGTVGIDSPEATGLRAGRTFGEIDISRAPIATVEAEASPVAAEPAYSCIRRTSLLAPDFEPNMELKFILESLLFSAQKPMSTKELRDVLATAAANAEGDETVKAFKKVKEDDMVAALEQLAKSTKQRVAVTGWFASRVPGNSSPSPICSLAQGVGRATRSARPA